MHPQKQHTSLQNRKIIFVHTGIYRWPDCSLCHKAYQKHDQANLYVNSGSHKHHLNKQASTQYMSPVYAEVPQFMGSLNMCITSTYYMAQCWEQVHPRIRISGDGDGKGENFRLSHAAPRLIHTAHDITAMKTTFTISGARDGCNVPSGRFNVQLCLMHGSPNRGRNPQ